MCLLPAASLHSSVEDSKSTTLVGLFSAQSRSIWDYSAPNHPTTCATLQLTLGPLAPNMTVLGQGLYREASELHATALQNQGRLNGNGGENSWHTRRDLQGIPVEQCTLYLPSQTMGCPMCFVCAWIWCCLPVQMRMTTELKICCRHQ